MSDDEVAALGAAIRRAGSAAGIAGEPREEESPCLGEQGSRRLVRTTVRLEGELEAAELDALVDAVSEAFAGEDLEVEVKRGAEESDVGVYGRGRGVSARMVLGPLDGGRYLVSLVGSTECAERG